MSKRKHRLTADLSELAYDAWHSFASRHGVTVTATLEAIGRRLGRGEHVELPVEEARVVTAERRRPRKEVVEEW